MTTGLRMALRRTGLAAGLMAAVQGAIVMVAVPGAMPAAVYGTAAAHAADAPPSGAASPCTAGCALPSADIVPDVPDLPAGVPVPPNDPAVQADLPGCAVWTDRCVTCQRDAGQLSCSNTGIACQPQAVECLRAATPPKP